MLNHWKTLDEGLVWELDLVLGCEIQESRGEKWRTMLIDK